MNGNHFARAGTPGHHGIQQLPEAMTGAQRPFSMRHRRMEFGTSIWKEAGPWRIGKRMLMDVLYDVVPYMEINLILTRPENQIYSWWGVLVDQMRCKPGVGLANVNAKYQSYKKWWPTHQPHISWNVMHHRYCRACSQTLHYSFFPTLVMVECFGCEE